MGFREENNKQRLEFVDFWSAYILTHDDKIWSKQQNLLINSQLRTANMTKADYLKMKNQKAPSLN